MWYRVVRTQRTPQMIDRCSLVLRSTRCPWQDEHQCVFHAPLQTAPVVGRQGLHPVIAVTLPGLSSPTVTRPVVEVIPLFVSPPRPTLPLNLAPPGLSTVSPERLVWVLKVSDLCSLREGSTFCATTGVLATRSGTCLIPGPERVTTDEFAKTPSTT